MISLSGLKRRVRRKSGPLINAAGRAIHRKRSSGRLGLHWSRTKLILEILWKETNRRHNQAHRPLCLLLYREIGLLKRYYEIRGTVYHSVEARVIVNGPGQTVSSRPGRNLIEPGTSIQVFVLSP